MIIKKRIYVHMYNRYKIRKKINFLLYHFSHIKLKKKFSFIFHQTLTWNDDISNPKIKCIKKFLRCRSRYTLYTKYAIHSHIRLKIYRGTSVYSSVSPYTLAKLSITSHLRSFSYQFFC